MLRDADDIASGTVLETDVCIIGTGPAGLSIARELRNSGLRVALLERGGPPGKPVGMEQSRVAITDECDFEPPPRVPPRFGGAANEWIVRLPYMRRGVRMVPLSPIDLETRSWVPFSGWPISWTELDRYYRRANGHLGLHGWRYDVADWSEADHPPLELERHGFTTAMERFPRSDVFTRDVWNELKSADDITVYLHAAAGELVGSADRVELIEIDAGSRGRLSMRAGTVVIAGGGLHNPRLLLNARRGRGLGNQYDTVGRYYMDHLRFISGMLEPRSQHLFDRMGLYDIASGRRGTRMGKIVPTADLMQRDRLLHSAAMLLPKPSLRVQHAVDEVTRSIDRLRAGDLRGALPTRHAVGRASRFVVGTLPEMAFRQRRPVPKTDAGWARLRRNHRRWDQFSVEHQVEQAPYPSNRLYLGSATDAFGRLQTQLDWRWSDIDLDSAARTQVRFDRAMTDAGIGEFDAITWEYQPDLTTPEGAFHPTGGTRMHPDPRQGVVDADGRVHGVANVYVAGSSVFPTGGYANPTLTIIALAIRLADRLKSELRTPVSTAPVDHTSAG